MKKLLLYVLLCSLFVSLIMTFIQGDTIIFTFKNMLDLFSQMPKVDMSPLYNSLINLDLSFWGYVPIIGTIIQISQSIMIAIIFICDAVIQVATFACYLVPRLFVVAS